MFKALAEFVMRGRMQAASIALIGSVVPLVLGGGGSALLFGLVPLLSQAVIALVTLRQGYREGAITLLWAIMPVLAWVATGRWNEILGLSTFISAYVAALVLRASVNWAYSLVAATLAAAICIVLLGFELSSVTDEFKALWGVLLESIEKQEAQPELRAFLEAWTSSHTSGLLACMVALAASIALIVARWLQSLLYNPGGFAEEFHGMRMPTTLAAVCVGLSALFVLWQSAMMFWSATVLVPLFFAGLGIVHWSIARFNMGTVGVVVTYVFLVFSIGIQAFVVLLALIDSAINLRKKIGSKQPKG